MEDVATELEEIKREIVESRALTIKTNNLVNALSADLKSIAKRQQSYERRTLVNSATAYVVTVVVLFVSLKFAWDARVDAVRAETKDSKEAVARLEKDLAAMREREEAARRGAAAAAAFYELVRQGKRREIVTGYDEIAKLELTRTERMVFERAAEQSKNELSLVAYQDGLDHVRTGRWHEAHQAFVESLRFKDDAVHSAQARYQLAKALRSLGRQREAIPTLMQLSEASSDKEVMDDATLLLAESQLDIQAWGDAKNTLRTFLRRFPDSPFVNEVRIRLADVSLHH